MIYDRAVDDTFFYIIWGTAGQLSSLRFVVVISKCSTAQARICRLLVVDMTKSVKIEKQISSDIKINVPSMQFMKVI